MRTTISIADDVYAAMEQLRQSEGLGPSDALNTLARRGISARREPGERYRLHPTALGLRVDARNIGEVLDLLDDAG